MSFFPNICLSLGLFCLCTFPCYTAPLAAPQKVDVLVLGGGSAGLTSALYLGRAGFSTLVLEGSSPGGAITQSNNVGNFPGYKEISGFDLTEQMRNQAEASGALLKKEEVLEVDLSKRPFSFIAQDVYDKTKKRKILADACVIALGSAARKLGVPGESLYWSKGVYSCAVCDGSLYKDKVVAVVGGGDSALLEADYLAGIAKKVYVLNRKDQFKGVEKVRQQKLLSLSNVEVLYNTKVKEIKGNGEKVETVVFKKKDGAESALKIDALFVSIGSIPNTQVLSKQVRLDDLGYIVLKKGTETSVPGVFAAGDVADPIFKQAVIASGEGAKAAMQASDYLHLTSTGAKSAIAKSEAKQEKTGKVIEVATAAQLKEIVESSKDLVLIDFYATWCGPCRHLGKFTDGWAEDLKDKATICKVNVDLARDLASRYRVQSMPTVIVVNSEGKEVGRKVGVEEIVQYINKLKN